MHGIHYAKSLNVLYSRLRVLFNTSFREIKKALNQMEGWQYNININNKLTLTTNEREGTK